MANGRLALFTLGILTGPGIQNGGATGPTVAPVNTVAPAITGTAIDTQTLTVSNGTWDNVPTSYTYQWQKGGVNIGGATANTYVLVTGDVGANITAIVTATNAIGSTPQVSNTVVPAAADTTPDAFVFTDVTGSNLSTVNTSNTITIAGVNLPCNVSITGGTYSKNGAAYTSAAGTAVLGDTFSVRGTSSGSYSTAVNVALTVGGTSDTYSVTTRAQVGPTAFAFTDATAAATSRAYTSDAIFLAGADTPWAISVTGGTYSINGGTFVSTAGTAAAGDSIRTQGTSSASAATAVNVALTVGGVSDTFTITTASTEAAPVLTAMSEPGQARRTVIAAYVDGLVTDTIWTKLDRLYVFAAHDSAAALLEWKVRGSATTSNGPTFTVDRGYAGNGASSRLGTGFTPSTNGVQYAQNDSSAWVWPRTNAQSGTSDAGNLTTVPNLLLVSRNTSNNTITRNNSGTSVTTSVGVDGTGLIGSQRRGSTDQRAYRNGAQIGVTSTQASTGLPPEELWVCGANSSQFSAKEIALFAVGASLTGLEAAFYSRTLTYLQAVGAA